MKRCPDYQTRMVLDATCVTCGDDFECDATRDSDGELEFWVPKHEEYDSCRIENEVA